jgi:hypothetical protein
MEFTQLVKKGSALLFLILLAHGLILGFTISTTVLSVVLVSVVCLFEAQLVKSERDVYERNVTEMKSDFDKKLILRTAEFEQQVIKLSEQSKLDKEQLKEHLDNLKSQINGMKMNNMIRK